mmetsp:Transcript_5869/g.14004  ORF Transcript_5869/g.14004 Transcript_5869/m.14004 type:complete len:271 (-) Transcript_5869:219-1031(-)
MPVEGNHGLSGELLLIQHLKAACYSSLNALLVFDNPLLRVGVLEEREGAVATAGCKDLAILWQEVRAPECGLGDFLRTPRIAFRGVVGSQVIDDHAGLEGRDSQLVHSDVLSIELQMAHTILHIGVPLQRHGPQVEHLDVAIVVAGRYNSLRIVVGVAKRNRPAIGRGLAFYWLQGEHWISLTTIPKPHCAIPAASQQLRCSISNAQPSTTIYGIDYLLMTFYAPYGFPQIFQVPDLHVATIISGSKVSIFNRRSAKGGTLESFRLLDFC